MTTPPHGRTVVEVAEDDLRPSTTSPTLGAAIWGLRVAVVVAAALVGLVLRPADPTSFTLKLAALVVMAVGTGVWFGLDRSPPVRSAPLTATLGVIVIAGALGSVPSDSAFLIGPALVAALSAGSDLPLRTGWVIAVTGVAVKVVASLTVGGQPSPLAIYSLLLFVALLVGHTRRAYRIRAEQAAALLRQSQLLRREERQLAALAERDRLAREIHDVLARTLGELIWQLHETRARVTGGDERAAVIASLDEVQARAAAGLAETRQAVLELRDALPPLPEYLSDSAARHTARYHVAVGVIVDGAPAGLPGDLNSALCRAADEALSNSARHAPGQPVELRLAYTAAAVTLTVLTRLPERSRRPDATWPAGSGYGLAGVRERLAPLGGRLDADVDGESFRFSARAPLPPT